MVCCCNRTLCAAVFAAVVLLLAFKIQEFSQQSRNRGSFPFTALGPGPLISH